MRERLAAESRQTFVRRTDAEADVNKQTKEIEVSLPRLERERRPLEQIFKRSLSQLPLHAQEAYWRAISVGYRAYLENPQSGLVAISHDNEIVSRVKLGLDSLRPGRWEEPVIAEFSRLQAADIVRRYGGALDDTQLKADKYQLRFMKEELAGVLGLGKQCGISMTVTSHEWGREICLHSPQKLLASVVVESDSVRLHIT